MLNETHQTPESELSRRIHRLQKKLDALHLDGALILQNTDLFYFAGTIQQSHLYVPSTGDPLLMVRKCYKRAMAESHLKTILPIASLKELPEILADHGIRQPKRLGIEMDVLPANMFFSYQRLFGTPEISDISMMIREIRSIKSPYEIDQIRIAAEKADLVAEYAETVAAEGKTEIELAGEIEAFARKLGHQGIVRMRLFGGEMFYGHLMAGPSAAIPSYIASPTGGGQSNPAVAQSAGFRPVQKGEPLLLDYVFAINGYLADHTRIFSIGPLPDDLLRAHDAMLELQELIMKQAVPGTRAGAIYDAALKKARQCGYADVFMGAESPGSVSWGMASAWNWTNRRSLPKGRTLKSEKTWFLRLNPN